jgi:alanyl-tRNA synthetase
MMEKTELMKKLEQLEAEKTQVLKQELKAKVKQTHGINHIIALIDIPNADQLKNLSFQLKQETENLFCVLGCVLQGKPMLSIILSDELVNEKKWHAGNMVKELAKEIKGGGGGQPFYATAGGNDQQGLQKALDRAQSYIS